MFVLQTQSKSLTLVFDLAPDVPQYVHIDQGKLRQVLINLLENAVKFTEKGSVALRANYAGPLEGASPSALAPPSRLIFEIEDTGVGIASDELDRVFDVFVQTGSGRRSAKGTGLGVPISREFVRLMGGDLTVDSQVDVGTVFRFEVLVDIADPADVSGGSWPVRRIVGLKPGSRAPDGGPFRLLVAEDMEASRNLLVEILRATGNICDDQGTAQVAETKTPLVGFEIREAVNGQEAIDIWKAWRPHLIWMDIRMPVLDGYQATEWIRTHSTTSMPVIIALTASAFEADRQKVMAAGCDDFIRKPFRETEIFDALTQHLGVEFVYQDIEPPLPVQDEFAAGIQEEERPVAVEATMVASLAKMPSRWLNEMHQATLEGDWDWMMALVAQIREREAGAPTLTADVLTELAYNFEHQTILELVEQAIGS
jgi:two-component system sensor histidine kinase/response regulator